ncbi:MAG: Rod shape-determining protein MreC [Rickettsiaceae bacterium]|nr:Rod shape-determining protein MreC [Rickettsiaceae bacterium]
MSIAESAMPIARVVSMPLNAVVGVAINFHDLIEARSKNELLIQENERLKSLYIKSLSIHEENEQLKKIVKYVSLRSSKYIVSRLIAHPHQTYSQNVFIDSGEAEGVRVDDIVTGNNALIGRITQVSGGKSRVLLVTDINSRVPVIVSGARTKAILAGNNSNVMELLYLEKNHHIAVGDMVFTSGDGDSLPPGLLVGIVTEVDGKYVEVEMVENVKNLDMISVINY